MRTTSACAIDLAAVRPPKPPPIMTTRLRGMVFTYGGYVAAPRVSTTPVPSTRRKLQTDRKDRGIAVRVLGRSEHKLISAAPENPIVTIAGRADALRPVGRSCMDAVRNGIIEIHLGGKFVGSAPLDRRADLQMDVHRPAFVPPRINGTKPRFPLRIRHLITAQKLAAERAERRILDIRIDTQSVAVPDIDLGAGKRLALPVTTDARECDGQGERDAGFNFTGRRIGSDIGTMQALLDEIRSFRLFRPKQAHRAPLIGGTPAGETGAGDQPHHAAAEQPHRLTARKQSPLRGVILDHGLSPRSLSLTRATAGFNTCVSCPIRRQAASNGIRQ